MNSDLLNERRRELALPRRQLARSVGVTPRLIELLEESDEPATHDTLAVATVRALELALGLSPTALLQDHEDTEPNPTAAADAALVANIIVRIGQPTTKTQLTTALHWRRARLEQALTSLRPALQACGMTLCEDREQLDLAPAHNPHAHRAATEIKSLAIEDDPQALSLIWRAWRAHLSRRPTGNTLEALAEADKPLARTLIASHILRIANRDELVLSEDTRKSLRPARHSNDDIIGRY